ncbi:hypothetical protein SANTM175S_01061 [Streptomyces antimycoticus]
MWLLISREHRQEPDAYILEKLQLHSRMEAVVYAMREKILEIR